MPEEPRQTTVANKEQREPDYKPDRAPANDDHGSTSDRIQYAIKRYTFWIMLATVLNVLVAAYQGLMTGRTLDFAQEQADSSTKTTDQSLQLTRDALDETRKAVAQFERLADEADEANRLQEQLLEITRAEAEAATERAKLLLEQAKHQAARDQAAAHREELALRRESLAAERDRATFRLQKAEFVVERGELLGVDLSIANGGPVLGSIDRIREAIVSVETYDFPTPTPEDDIPWQDTDNPAPATVEPSPMGAVLYRRFTPVTDQMLGELEDGGALVYYFEIQYSDKQGKREPLRRCVAWRTKAKPQRFDCSFPGEH